MRENHIIFAKSDKKKNLCMYLCKLIHSLKINTFLKKTTKYIFWIGWLKFAKMDSMFMFNMSSVIEFRYIFSVRDGQKFFSKFVSYQTKRLSQKSKFTY